MVFWLIGGRGTAAHSADSARLITDLSFRLLWVNVCTTTTVGYTNFWKLGWRWVSHIYIFSNVDQVSGYRIFITGFSQWFLSKQAWGSQGLVWQKIQEPRTGLWLGLFIIRYPCSLAKGIFHWHWELALQAPGPWGACHFILKPLKLIYSTTTTGEIEPQGVN